MPNTKQSSWQPVNWRLWPTHSFSFWETHLSFFLSLSLSLVCLDPCQDKCLFCFFVRCNSVPFLQYGHLCSKIDDSVGSRDCQKGLCQSTTKWKLRILTHHEFWNGKTNICLKCDASALGIESVLFCKGQLTIPKGQKVMAFGCPWMSVGVVFLEDSPWRHLSWTEICDGPVWSQFKRNMFSWWGNPRPKRFLCTWGLLYPKTSCCFFCLFE